MIYQGFYALNLLPASQVLQPGGSVLIRDYGLHDHAQLRFDAKSKISDNFYVRQDGTRAYYFSLGWKLSFANFLWYSELRSDNKFCE